MEVLDLLLTFQFNSRLEVKTSRSVHTERKSTRYSHQQLSSNIRSIYQTEWVVALFARELYSPIQKKIRPDFGDGLNFVACEDPFTSNVRYGYLEHVSLMNTHLLKILSSCV